MIEKKFSLGFNAMQVGLVFFFSLIGSAAPVWSFTTFKIQLGILFLGILIAVYWYRTMGDARKYNLFVAADMIVLMGLFGTVSLLRLAYGTIVFQVLLIVYLLFLFHSVLKNIVMHRLPDALKYLPAILLSTAMTLLISLFFLKGSQGSIIATLYISSDGAIVLTFFLYVIGVFMTWMGMFVLREFFEKPPEKERMPARKVRKKRKRR
jgi:hypothetical protein